MKAVHLVLPRSLPPRAVFRVSCPLDLDDPEFGSVEIQGDGKEGSLAVYSCDRGYEVVGEAERVCEMVGMAGREGAWSGDEPTCQSEYTVLNHF